MDTKIYDNYVLNIAKYGSLTKASNALGISQPALSSGLSSLEKSLGIKIFNRKTTPISFTPEGKIYYEYIQKSEVMKNDYMKRMKSVSGEINNKVVIGCPVVYAESVLADALIKLKSDFPISRVQVKTSLMSELINMADNGEIDCFISTSDQLPKQFVKKKIYTELLYLVVPKDNEINKKLKQDIKKTKKINDWSVLSNQQFVFLEKDQPLQIKVDSFLKQKNIRYEREIVVDQVSTALNFSLKGLGISFVSGESLSREIKLDNVEIYPLPKSVFVREIFVAYNKDLYLTDMTSKLISILSNNENIQ